MINKHLKSLLPLILSFTILTGILHYLSENKVYYYVWLALFYNITLTLLSVPILLKAKKKDNIVFTTTSMAVSLGRLLISGGILFVYYFYIGIDKQIFTIAFFIYYFIFTINETVFIKRNIINTKP